MYTDSQRLIFFFLFVDVPYSDDPKATLRAGKKIYSKKSQQKFVSGDSLPNYPWFNIYSKTSMTQILMTSLLV